MKRTTTPSFSISKVPKVLQCSSIILTINNCKTDDPAHYRRYLNENIFEVENSKRPKGQEDPQNLSMTEKTFCAGHSLSTNYDQRSWTKKKYFQLINFIPPPEYSCNICFPKSTIKTFRCRDNTQHQHSIIKISWVKIKFCLWNTNLIAFTWYCTKLYGYMCVHSTVTNYRFFFLFSSTVRCVSHFYFILFFWFVTFFIRIITKVQNWSVTFAITKRI